MALDIKAGIYKARVVKQPDGEWAQYGESNNQTPQINLDVELQLDGGKTFRATTPLYFSPAAAQYSIDRLRACGWKGADLTNLEGVGDNEVSVEVSHEEYEGDLKTKVQIMSGAGRFNVANPVEKASWAAKVAAITGNSGAAAPAAAPKPNF